MKRVKYKTVVLQHRPKHLLQHRPKHFRIVIKMTCFELKNVLHFVIFVALYVLQHTDACTVTHQSM